MKTNKNILQYKWKTVLKVLLRIFKKEDTKIENTLMLKLKEYCMMLYMLFIMQKKQKSTIEVLYYFYINIYF